MVYVVICHTCPITGKMKVIYGGDRQMERVKKELNVEIGRRLREIRENMGYTQFRFAEILGVVEEHYRKIELGSSGLTLEKVLILYERLNIDATYLIVGKRKDKFDLDDILTNCSKVEKRKILHRLLEYMDQMVVFAI